MSGSQQQESRKPGKLILGKRIFTALSHILMIHACQPAVQPQRLHLTSLLRVPRPGLSAVAIQNILHIAARQSEIRRVLALRLLPKPAGLLERRTVLAQTFRICHSSLANPSQDTCVCPALLQACRWASACDWDLCLPLLKAPRIETVSR